MRARTAYNLTQVKPDLFSVSIGEKELQFKMVDMFRTIESHMIANGMANNLTCIDNCDFDTDEPWIAVVYNLPFGFPGTDKNGNEIIKATQEPHLANYFSSDV